MAAWADLGISTKPAGFGVWTGGVYSGPVGGAEAIVPLTVTVPGGSWTNEIRTISVTGS